MIKTVAEHKVDMSLLPEKANILDIGCRGFQFYEYFKNLGHDVYPVDIDILETDHKYYLVGITDINGKMGVEKTNDPQGTRLKEGDEIIVYTLETFSALQGINKWDLIKMDVEGSEFNIIMGMTRPMAKQLSIEFHLHTGVYSEIGMQLMERQLKNLGYNPVSHELTNQHGAGFNYWDSLWVWQNI